jgi:hypothetical protein
LSRCRTALALLALPAIVSCHPPEVAFTARVARRVRERLPGVSVTVKGPLHLEVGGPDDKGHQMYLENLWRICQGDPEECEKSIDRSAAVILEDQASNAAFLKPESVRAVLQHRERNDNVARLMKDGDPEKTAENAVVSRPFVADLFVVYGFDLPDGIRMMNRKDLRDLKLDEEQVHALALGNLEKAAPEMAPEAIEPGSRVRVLHIGDSYDASRVLLHGRWKGLADSLAGGLLVAIPSRDFVFFTGASEDPSGLRDVAERAVAENDHALSAVLLRWTPGGWEEWKGR